MLTLQNIGNLNYYLFICKDIEDEKINRLLTLTHSIDI